MFEIHWLQVDLNAPDLLRVLIAVKAGRGSRIDIPQSPWLRLLA